MPETHPRRFDLAIRLLTPGEPVPVRVVVERLASIQAALVHVGDYLTGSDFRVRGVSTRAVRAKCTLLVKEAGVGSFTAGLELAPYGLAETGLPGLGEAALARFQQLISAVEQPGDLGLTVDSLVADPRHRTRILKDLVEVWPGERDDLTVDVLFEGQEPSRLSPRGRVLLEGLTYREGGAEATSVKGVLGTVHVNPGEEYIRVTGGPDGTVRCLIGAELKESARSLLGKPVVASGQAEFDGAGNVRLLASVDRIEPFREVTLQRIFSDERELVLRQPLGVSIDYRDQRWAAENDDLGVFASNEDYDECLKEFQDEFFFAWQEYGSAAEADLTPGARELRRALRELVGGIAQ